MLLLPNFKLKIFFDIVDFLYEFIDRKLKDVLPQNSLSFTDCLLIFS